MSRRILEEISQASEFDQRSGAGTAFQIDVEDPKDMASQMNALARDLLDGL